MKADLRYHGRSGVDLGPYRSTLKFAPNLAREPVWFTGELERPVRFREAISALHEVVVGDFRFQKRDKTRYHAWKAQKAQEDRELRQKLISGEVDKELARLKRNPPPPDLRPQFRKAHRTYWNARVRWANELMRNDPELFRHLVPCDPVVTVAPDVMFFEGFAKDESSYGCVFLDRNAIKGEQTASLGTTNVDYSLGLFDSFQTLRTYRSTRLHVDPQGFEVKTEGGDEHREEKIDLPPSWLRGFAQISAAMGLTTTRVELGTEAVYSLLAHLKRHREKHGPRSIRFALTPGRAPEMILDPWEIRVPGHGRVWEGERPTEIKVWGRRRLMVLARLLPLVERFEVHLLGTGLPSIWVAHMGELRFVLALSGWTTNNWSGGAGLELLSGTFAADALLVDKAEIHLRDVRTVTPRELAQAIGAPERDARAAMFRVAARGQAIYDFATGQYRFREILDASLAEMMRGPEPTELVEGRKLFVEAKIKVAEQKALSRGRTLYVANIGPARCEAIVDRDTVFQRAKCGCSHHRRFGLRKGPCRHLLALRLHVVPPAINLGASS